MLSDMPRLILASGSPRRREILTRLGFVFTVKSADVDESTALPPAEAVKELALRKAAYVKQFYTSGIIVSADTLVSLDDQALGKPKDEDDAFRMLSSLSGRRHQVYTGLCLMSAESGESRTACVRSDVYFKALTAEQITAYIKTGEPMDKAGAYAIQGLAAPFIEKYEGPYDNIVGFPSETFLQLLKAFTDID